MLRLYEEHVHRLEYKCLINYSCGLRLYVGGTLSHNLKVIYKIMFDAQFILSNCILIEFNLKHKYKFIISIFKILHQ